MANGIWHVAMGIEIDLTREDLGNPGMPGLWELLYKDKRPVPDRGLQCLECREDRPRCPESMFLRIRNGVREAVHFNQSIGAHPRKVESDDSHSTGIGVADRAQAVERLVPRLHDLRGPTSQRRSLAV